MTDIAKVAYPPTDDHEQKFAPKAVNPDGTKIASRSGNAPVQEDAFTYTTAATTLEFAKIPANGINIECDTDVWVRADGQDATKDRNSKRLVANVPYRGLFPGATEISIIADSTGGDASIDYDSEDNS